MATDLPYAAYGAIGAEPWLYPYSRKDHYQTQLPHNGELRGALATPLVLGPGWYKGFRVHFDPSAITTYDTRKAMPSYGYIANLPGPRRGVYPVRDPVGGFRRPHGPVKAAAYIPSGLPIIRPGPGWHIGPSIYSNLPVGTVYGGPEEVSAAEKPALEALRGQIYSEGGLGVGGGTLLGLIGYVVAAKVIKTSDKTAENLLIAGLTGGVAYALWKGYSLISGYRKGA
jgi:hypothetical protein